MEKNIIQQRLELTDKLLESVNSKEEFLFLLGVKEALMPLRYFLDMETNHYEDHWLGKNQYQIKRGAKRY